GEQPVAGQRLELAVEGGGRGRRLRPLERRVEGGPQRGGEPGREAVGVEPLPVLQGPGVVPGRVRHQPAEQHLPFEERRLEADRLQGGAGGLVVVGFVPLERGQDGVVRDVPVRGDGGPVPQPHRPVGGVLDLRRAGEFDPPGRGGGAGPGQMRHLPAPTAGGAAGPVYYNRTSAPDHRPAMNFAEAHLLSPYRPPTSYPVSLNPDEAAAWLGGYFALWHPAALARVGRPPVASSSYDHD